MNIEKSGRFPDNNALCAMQQQICSHRFRWSGYVLELLIKDLYVIAQSKFELLLRAWYRTHFGTFSVGIPGCLNVYQLKHSTKFDVDLCLVRACLYPTLTMYPRAIEIIGRSCSWL